MATHDELVRAVLEEIEERGTGQPIAPENASKVKNALPGLFDDLLQRNVIFASIPADIEPAQFLWLTKYVAWRLARPFGLGDDAGLAADGLDAENKLRVLARINRGTGQNLKVDPALIIQRRRSYVRISN